MGKVWEQEGATFRVNVYRGEMQESVMYMNK